MDPSSLSWDQLTVAWLARASLGRQQIVCVLCQRTWLGAGQPPRLPHPGRVRPQYRQMNFNFILLEVPRFVVAKTFLNALLNNISKSCHALALTHPRVSVNNSPGRRHFALPEFLTDPGGEGVVKCAGLPRPATLVVGSPLQLHSSRNFVSLALPSSPRITFLSR